MEGRYANLEAAINATVGNAKPHKPYRIAEIGTYDGRRALQLAGHARRRGRPTVEYYGFDLFEHLTPERSRQELSKSRLPPSRSEVHRRLREAGIKAHLFLGDTRQTLPAELPVLPFLDLIFCDGGHSLETVASDLTVCLSCLQVRGVLIADDYYDNRDDFGCRSYIETLRAEQGDRYDIRLLDPVDRPSTGLEIRMVWIQRRPEVRHAPAQPVPQNRQLPTLHPSERAGCHPASPAGVPTGSPARDAEVGTEYHDPDPDGGTEYRDPDAV